MKNLHKTLLFTLILTLIIVSLAVSIQIRNKETLQRSCSYFDPIAIDILAIIASLFLITEGSIKIFKNHNKSLKGQFTRATRVTMGFTILTIHIMQFLQK
ncbi:hypothetical protein HOE04_03305 [archaeon]|jgi:hypothetical protein|nr:hypothetical protein [archaeon]